MISILETERLILKQFNQSDALNLFDLNSDTEVLKFTGDVPFKNLEEAEKFVINYTDYLKNGFGRWAVILKSNQKFIGWCGLKLNEENLIDIGFRLFKREWNKGYATEATKGVLIYGFETLNLPTIIGRVSSDNLASIRVLEKAHMIYWKEEYCEGLGQTKYYKITKDAFIDLL